MSITNISDFCSVNYRILVVLQEHVYHYPVWDACEWSDIWL